jgi:hypothetical protein
MAFKQRRPDYRLENVSKLYHGNGIYTISLFFHDGGKHNLVCHVDIAEGSTESQVKKLLSAAIPEATP